MSSTFQRWSTAFPLLGVLWSCSGTSTSGPSVEEASADYATALCGKFESCVGPAFQALFASKEACVARYTTLATFAFKAPSTGTTVDAAVKCSQAISTSSCEEFNGFLANNPPEACRPAAGTLGPSAACGDDAQCASKFCKKSESSNCGVCSTQAAQGAGCARSSECEAGFVCIAKKCAKEGDAGATCSDSAECRAGLYCKDGACTETLGAGAACDPATQRSCNQAAGFWCAVQTRICTAIKLANAGESCGLVNGEGVACRNGTCIGSEGTRPGTCTPYLSDGQACLTASDSPKCQAAATCVNGACTLDDPSLCK